MQRLRPLVLTYSLGVGHIKVQGSAALQLMLMALSLFNTFQMKKKDFFPYLQVRDYFSEEIKQTEENETQAIRNGKENQARRARVRWESQTTKTTNTDHFQIIWD